MIFQICQKQYLCQTIAVAGVINYPDTKVHGENMGPTWVLSAPDGPHIGPMNLDIRVPAYKLPALYQEWPPYIWVWTPGIS